jgi:Planctomycete cytochrome C
MALLALSLVSDAASAADAPAPPAPPLPAPAVPPPPPPQPPGTTVPLPAPLPAPRPRRPPTFAADVAPVLARWCVSCHGGPEPEANLRLESYETLLAGGDSGPPIIAGDPGASLLVAKVERRDRPAMPPRKRLPRAAVATLRAWIAAGALP